MARCHQAQPISVSFTLRGRDKWDSCTAVDYSLQSLGIAIPCAFLCLHDTMLQNFWDHDAVDRTRKLQASTMRL